MGKFKVPPNLIRKADCLSKAIKKEQKPTLSEILTEKLRKLKLENLKSTKCLTEYIEDLRIGSDPSVLQQDEKMAVEEKTIF